MAQKVWAHLKTMLAQKKAAGSSTNLPKTIYLRRKMDLPPVRHRTQPWNHHPKSATRTLEFYIADCLKHLMPVGNFLNPEKDAVIKP